MADWSALPMELWELVARRLHLADYYRFAAVCSTWRSLVQERRHCKFPWLVLSDVDSNRQDPDTHPFFNLFDNKVCGLQVPEIGGKRCCGSSHGWLITASENSDSFNLLNPFSRAQIPLPPPSAFPHTQYSNPAYPRNHYFIHKAVLSGDPATSSEYTVMAIYSEKSRLAFFKSGTERWIYVESSSIAFTDLFYYNGQFYADSLEGRVVVCDLGDHPKAIEMAPSVYTRHGRLPRWRKVSHHSKPYLVESSGELLEVWRMINDDGPVEWKDLPSCTTFSVKVFKIDKKMRGGRIEVSSLGNDVVLFLGHNSSISFSVKGFPSFKGNRIYFEDDHFGLYISSDFVVYDFEDGSVKPYLPAGLTHSYLSPPIWVLPNPW